MTDDNDALFDEASDELQEEVREDLSDAEEALPDADAFWELDSGNVVGVLNQLQSTVKVEDAQDSFQEARKSFLLGEKADAFSEEEQENFESRFEDIEDAVTSMTEVRESVENIIPKVPEVKSALENVAEEAVEEDDETESEPEEGTETESVEDDSDGDGSVDEGEESEGAAESWGSDDGSSGDGEEASSD